MPKDSKEHLQFLANIFGVGGTAQKITKRDVKSTQAGKKAEPKRKK